MPIAEAFGRAGATVSARMLSAASTLERISLIEELLIGCLETPDPYVARAQQITRAILEGGGGLTVKELCALGGTSPRQLSRQFQSAVGLSPKHYSRIIRFQRALLTLSSQRVTRLTDATYAADYFDQSHFNRDFRAFTGLRPGQYADERLRMTVAFESE